MPDRPPGSAGPPAGDAPARPGTAAPLACPEHESTTTVSLQWNLSRHARRLLTLALAGLALALVTRRPEFAGVAAPALLLLSPWRPGTAVARPGDDRADREPADRR